MKRMLLIKRKGFNYYTDYTELYLHRSFENKGYYLVKEESKSVFSVIVDISETEKYMTALSPYFNTLSDEEIKEFAELLSVNFKSEVIVLPYEENYKFKGIPCRMMFSDTHNAFEEDAYVYDSRPEFIRECFSDCISYQPYVIEHINYGGAFNGLDITLTFDSSDVELEETTLNYFKGKDRISKEIIFEKSGNKFKCSRPDFIMDKGINKYSAVLRGKKRENEKSKCGFYIRFVPKSATKILNPEMIVEA